MVSLKNLCYLSGVFNMIIAVYFGCYAYKWYTNPENKDIKFKRATIHDVWIRMTVCSVLAFVFTIGMIVGVVKEKSKLILPFLFVMQLITYSIVVEAIVVLFRHISKEYPADTVAAEFFTQIGIAVAIIISLIPCFKLYTQYAGHSFFSFLATYFPCCRFEQKPTQVPNE